MMKKSLLVLAAIAAVPLFQSCVAPSGYAYGGGYDSYGYDYSPSYTASVGIIRTSSPRWGYDPFYRSYYDYSLGQYYNISTRSYYRVLPRRYSSPYYPPGYRRGAVIQCPTHLPYYSSSYRHRDYNFARTNNNRWSYDPYRRAYYDQQSHRYYDTGSRSYYSQLPKRYDSPKYPSGYRQGQPVQLHQNLPYVSHDTRSRGQSRSVTPDNYQRGSQRDQRDYRNDQRGFQQTFPGNSDSRYDRGQSGYRGRGSSQVQRDSSSYAAAARESQERQMREMAARQQQAAQSQQRQQAEYAARQREAASRMQEQQRQQFNDQKRYQPQQERQVSPRNYQPQRQEQPRSYQPPQQDKRQSAPSGGSSDRPSRFRQDGGSTGKRSGRAMY